MPLGALGLARTLIARPTANMAADAILPVSCYCKLPDRVRQVPLPGLACWLTVVEAAAQRALRTLAKRYFALLKASTSLSAAAIRALKEGRLAVGGHRG